MWDLACSDDEKYTVFQSEYLIMDRDLRCRLEPMGKDYFKTWVVAGIAKEFTHKAAINQGYEYSN